MLITDQRCHGDGCPQYILIQHAHDARGIDHARQDLGRDIHHLEQILIPLLGDEVKEHGAPCVGRIRHMRMPLDQVIGQVAVHRAKAQLAASGPIAQIQLIQQPLQLGPREIGIRHQASLLPDDICIAFFFKGFHIICRAPALPDNGTVNRPAGFPIP